ncbi:MAG: hypothetical protein ACREDF_00230 [Thermoplasmata archaeon]
MLGALDSLCPRDHFSLPPETDLCGRLFFEDVYGVLYRGRQYDVGDKVGWLRPNPEHAKERDGLRAGMKEFLDKIRKGS